MQKIKLLCLLFLVTCFSAIGQKTPILLSSDQLSQKITSGNVVILHVGTKEDFEKEHIPGALFVSPGDYTYDDEENNIVFDRPEDSVLKSYFESLGISNDTEVIVYTPVNWIPLVTRLYFTLDYLGHGDMTSILDGGLVAWKASGREVTKEVMETQKGNFEIKPNSSLLADTKYMKSSIENQGNTIIDCRSEAYYKAIKPTHGARLGRIPNSRSIPYTSLYAASDIGAYKFKSLKELENIFNSQDLDNKEPLVLYCHIGMQLTVVYTAAKMLGYNNVKMYDPSFNVWGKDDSLPIEQE
ncbi:MAG: rhodanese-like domain-containing protein [Ekhidna sp.]